MKSILQRMYTSGKTSVRTLRCFLFLYSCSNANSDALIMHIERGLCHSDALISHMEREAFVTPRAKHPVAIRKVSFHASFKGNSQDTVFDIYPTFTLPRGSQDFLSDRAQQPGGYLGFAQPTS